MAFFDQLANLTPDQNQALLSAASQILQASGPSRTPTSIGQILGGGLQAYQQGLQGAQDRNFQTQVRDLQLQELQGTAADRERARQEAEQLRQFYLNRGRQQQQGQSPLAQAQSVLGNNLAPTQANADALSAAQQTAPTQPQGQPSIYQQRLGEAQALRDAGFHAQADAAEKAALAFAPKVKNWQEVKVGDSVRYAPFYEDGTSGQPVTLEVARKLEKANTGQATQFVDPYTGRVVSSLQNTATPGELLSASTTIRGQNLVDARSREANALKAAEGKAPTEFQGKSAAFGLRAEEANKILNNLQGKYSPAAINSKLALSNTPIIGGILGSATNLALSPEDQQVEQAQRDFLNATLRQESGAAIGVPEFRNGQLQYFPQPGDSPQVIAQKARNRELVIQGFQGNAGKAKLTAPMIPAANGGWSIQRVGG